MTTQTPQSFTPSGAGGDPMPSTEGGASARERAAQVGGTAKDEAAGVAQEVRYQARDLAGEARSQVRQQVDTQKGRLSDLLREIGDDLEQMASGSERSGVAGDLVRQAAARARDARTYLDGDGDLLGDVRRFARRRPGTFLLGALAAGVLAGRATRAAAAARKQQSGAGSADRRSGGTPSTSPGYAAGGYAAGMGTAAAATGTYAGTYTEPYAAEPYAAGGQARTAAEADPGATYPEATGYTAADYPVTGGSTTGYAAADDTVLTEPGTATREYQADYRADALPPEREERR